MEPLASRMLQYLTRRKATAMNETLQPDGTCLKDICPCDGLHHHAVAIRTWWLIECRVTVHRHYHKYDKQTSFRRLKVTTLPRSKRDMEEWNTTRCPHYLLHRQHHQLLWQMMSEYQPEPWSISAEATSVPSPYKYRSRRRPRIGVGVTSLFLHQDHRPPLQT